MATLTGTTPNETAVEQTSGRSNERIPVLDGIRGVAILFVILYHWVWTVPHSDRYLHYLIPFSPLWSGVDLFFVLSGFLIGGILIDVRGSSRFFKTFYIRRICRIFPLFLFMLGVFIVAPKLFSVIHEGWWSGLFQTKLPLVSFLTMTQNIAMVLHGSIEPRWLGISWSLAVEEQFYLTLPLIVRFVPMKKLWYVISGFVVAAPILRFLVYSLHYRHWLIATYVLMPCRGDALGLGVLCALAYREPRAWRFFRSHTAELYCLAGTTLFVTTKGFIFSAHHPETPAILLVYTGYALFYATLLVLVLTDRKPWIRQLFGNPVLERFGILAYCLYLLHQGFLGLTHGLFFGHEPANTTLGQVAVTVGSFFAVVAIAQMSWIWIERPLIRWSHSWKY